MRNREFWFKNCKIVRNLNLAKVTIVINIIIYYVYDFSVFCKLLAEEFAMRGKTQTVCSMVPRQL